MADAPVTLEAVQRLVLDTVASVLAVDGGVSPDARFDEDLHADSLDLVEVVDVVERALAADGVAVDLADDALHGMRTPRQAAALIHAAVRSEATADG